jgi:hypothetical protein
MTTEYEQLLEQYRRLYRAAQAVVDASHYPTADDEEAKVFASQLRVLERELKGRPQHSAFATMSAS